MFRSKFFSKKVSMFVAVFIALQLMPLPAFATPTTSITDARDVTKNIAYAAYQSYSSMGANFAKSSSYSNSSRIAANTFKAARDLSDGNIWVPHSSESNNASSSPTNITYSGMAINLQAAKTFNTIYAMGSGANAIAQINVQYSNNATDWSGIPAGASSVGSWKLNSGTWQNFGSPLIRGVDYPASGNFDFTITVPSGATAQYVRLMYSYDTANSAMIKLGSFEIYNLDLQTSLSPTSASCTNTTQDGVSITLLPVNGETVSGITENGASIGSGNYSISGNTLKLLKTYISSLSLGKHTLNVNFNNRASVIFTLNITPNIDYSMWNLQQPDNSTITPAQLVAGYSSPYFYIGSDGGQVLMDPQTGVPTSGSTHPRCELRELTNGKNAAWNWTGTNTMTNTASVSMVGGGASGKTAIAQVYNSTDSIPLCELMYTATPNVNGGNFHLLYEEAKGAGTYIYLSNTAALNTKFTYKMSLSGGVLTVYINGTQVYTRTPSFSGKTFYFKCGNYDQTAISGTLSAVPYTVVELYSVDVVHS